MDSQTRNHDDSSIPTGVRARSLTALVNPHLLSALLLVLALLMYLPSGITVVNPDEDPGLHLILPWPFEKVIRVNANRVYRVEVGFRTDPTLLRNVSAMEWETLHYKIQGYEKLDEEAIALSGDEYIVDFSLVVQYRPRDAVTHLFHVIQIQEVVRGLAESCMREVLASEESEHIMTERRSQVLERIKDKMNHAVDRLGLGVEILAIHCHDVHPPLLTLAMFRDVFSAREDMVKYINDAEAQRNQALPKARAESENQLADALAFEQERIMRAEGEAEKFELTSQASREGPDVTGYRLFVETVEQVLAGRNKYIANPEANTGGYELWMYTRQAEQGEMPGGL
jgi:membrane protease subunit HflK